MWKIRSEKGKEKEKEEKINETVTEKTDQTNTALKTDTDLSHGVQKD